MALLPAVRLGVVAAVAGVALLAGAWVSMPSAPPRPSNITVLYVGADDCAPCRVWQKGDGVRFRSSTAFSRVTYREIKSPTLLDLLTDANWPEELRPYRERLGRGVGVPLWLVIADGEIVGRGFGPSQWRETVLPQIKSLLR